VFKCPGVYMRISFFGNTFNFFFTRVLHNGCSWGLALLADDSWVVWALEPDGGWPFDGDFILFIPRPLFPFFTASLRTRTSGD
jgi:hypothetical protein